MDNPEVAQLRQLLKQSNAQLFDAGRRHGELDRELRNTREDAALIVHALNCAVQLIESLIAYYPDGSPMHPSVATGKAMLDQAMAAFTSALQKRKQESEP